MHFCETSTTKEFPLLRMASETGRWELGFWPAGLGVHVRLGLAGDCAVDYCCGTDAELRAQVLLVMLIILKTVPETVSRSEIDDLFPRSWLRPIDRDQVWPLLVEFARERDTGAVHVQPLQPA